MQAYYDRAAVLANEVDRTRRSSDIHRQLARELADELEDLGIPFPSPKTTLNAVKKARAHDASGDWEFRPGSGEEARLVLEALRALAGIGGSVPLHLTNDTAAWVVAIRQAAPSLGPHSAIALASLYRARLANHTSTGDLDYFLAMGPWRGPSERWAYHAAVKRGFVTRVAFAARSNEDEAADLRARITEERRAAGFIVDDEEASE